MEILEPLLAQKYQELVNVQRQQRDWERCNRLAFFKPEPYQEGFFQSKSHVRMAFGSNRSGKTTCGLAEDISFALGFRPWELPPELATLPLEELLFSSEIPLSARTPVKTPTKVLILEDDWDTADEILITGTQDRAGKLTHYLPKECLDGKPEKNSLGYFCQWHLKNGSSIRIDTEKSFVNDPGSFEGGSGDLIHYDEPKKRELRVALKRGLVDRYGYEIFTLTPLAEPWMKDELYDKAATDPEISVHFFDTELNSHISKAGWEEFKKTLTEDEKEARIHGRWIHLRGLVYKEFIPRLYQDGGNLIEPVSLDWIKENATIYDSIDPHPRQPLAWLGLAADKMGRLIVWDEIFVKCLIPEFCDLIKSKLGNVEPERTTIDPIAFIADPVDGRHWANEFWDNNIAVQQASKARAQGIMDVRKAFAERRLLICTNCFTLIHELQHYVYQEWKSGSQRSEKEKPIDKDDHLVECLYRLVIGQPEYMAASKHKPVTGWGDCP